jgi:hypothetical protein
MMISARFRLISSFVDAVSALVPLAKKFASEEPSIETIGGENVISWPSVVSLRNGFVNKMIA